MKLRSERVVTATGVRPAVVSVRDGVVVAIDDGAGAGGIEDLGTVALIPGLVDPHVHINEPGRTEWEGFTTATRAAAVGGTRSVASWPAALAIRTPENVTWAPSIYRIESMYMHREYLLGPRNSSWGPQS